MSQVEQTRRVNWRQAFAEVALILFGVIVALAVDNWWSEQQERKEETAYLTALLEDFQSNRQSLAEAVEDQKGVISVGEGILRVLQKGLNEENTDVFLQRLGELYFFPSWIPVTGTYDDLVGSGKLLLIRNLDLRKELSSFQKELVSIREFEELQSETYYENQAPFINNHWDGTKEFWLSHASWLEINEPPEFPYDSDLEPYESPEFWNLVVAWMWVHADVISAYRAGIVACDRIIGLISAELESA